MEDIQIARTGYSEGNSIEVPFRCVLHQFKEGEYATHMQRKDNGDYFYGNYYRDLDEAHKAFYDRVEKHNKTYKYGNASFIGPVILDEYQSAMDAEGEADMAAAEADAEAEAEAIAEAEAEAEMEA